MEQYRPGGFNLLPPLIKNLIIINGLFFLAYITLIKVFQFDLNDYLGLHYFQSEKFNPIQYITYMFLHGGIGHIFFNMFALWMFGNVLENVWGPKRFLIYYIVTGVGAALIHTIVIYLQVNPVITNIDLFLNNPTFDQLSVFISSHKFQATDLEIQHVFNNFKSNFYNWQMNPDDTAAKTAVIDFILKYRESFLNGPTVVGASGAVFGILLAFGMLFPNALIYIYFAIPVKAKYFVVLYGIAELYMGFANYSGDNVAHFAHLGGMLFGFFLIRYWKKTTNRFF